MDCFRNYTARGGSKGIPKKNIHPIAGKPLIEYSILFGLEAVKYGLLKRCIVSTDATEIGKIAEQCGGDVPFLRPDIISGDQAKSIGYVEHALEFLKEKGEVYDAVLILQPTSPLRKTEDIKELSRIIDENDPKSIISVFKEDYINDKVMYYKEGDLGIPLNESHNKGGRRQDDPDVFVRNGMYYYLKKDLVVNQEVLIGDEPYLLEVPNLGLLILILTMILAC
jgi:CMP-N,N'-diacetyllegionaminic acid synthase